MSLVNLTKNFFKYSVDGVLYSLKSLDMSKLLDVIDLCHSQRDSSRIFVAGNGGSISTATHFANDLRTLTPSYRAYCLNDVNALSCIANDRGYQNVFAEQLSVLADPGDILFLLSASGSSLNLIEAVKLADSLAVTTVGIVGFDGGILKPIVNTCLHVESSIGAYREVEDCHSIICHFIIEELMNRDKDFKF